MKQEILSDLTLYLARRARQEGLLIKTEEETNEGRTIVKVHEQESAPVPC